MSYGQVSVYSKPVMGTVEELDDPYLELFDRINQLEMDIQELRALLISPKPHPFQWSQWEYNPTTGEVTFKDVAQEEFKFFE